MPITHEFVSTVPDGADTSLVRPLDWNADHVGGQTTGTATIDFGAFPGASDTSLAVTGQAGILSGSIVQAWIRPEVTADHSPDEHRVETLHVMAADIDAGTGFTIYGMNTDRFETLLWGEWSVAWTWS